MSEYAQCFAENRIGFSALPDLTDDDLINLGVSLRDRRKLLKSIAKLADARGAISRGRSRRKLNDNAERRYLTVLFCDLVGSTDLANRLDPEDVGGVMSQ